MAGISLAVLLAACSSSSSRGPSGVPTAQHDICAVFAQFPEWRDIARDVERRWGAPVAVQMAIIQQESGFQARVVPVGRSSSAFGYAQAIDSTWDWYRDDTGNSGADRDDFEDAADFVGWYMARTARTNGVGMNDVFNQYLAYHEGHTGFARASYRSKPWLTEVAARVAARAARYRGQLRGCA